MAATYNRTIIIGRLGDKPELKTTTKSGKTVEYTSFKMCNATFRDGVEEIQWHDMLAFGKQAKVIVEHLNKGDLCCVEGRLDKKMLKKDGETRYAMAIIAERVTFLSSKKREEPAEEATQAE